MEFKTLIRVVIAALASYRVGRMLATETGPFDLFGKWRGWVFTWQAKKHGPKTKTWITEGVECPLCVGFYISVLMLALTNVKGFRLGVLWLAVAGLQTAIQKQERE